MSDYNFGVVSIIERADHLLLLINMLRLRLPFITR